MATCINPFLAGAFFVLWRRVTCAADVPHAWLALWLPSPGLGRDRTCAGLAPTIFFSRRTLTFQFAKFASWGTFAATCADVEFP